MYKTIYLYVFISIFSLSGCAKKKPSGPEKKVQQIDAAATQVKQVSPDIQVTTRGQEHMSTYVTISVAAPKDADPLPAIEAAFAEVKRLSFALSEWRPDSPVSAINKAAGVSAVVVPEELYKVIKAALEVSQNTGGAFDVSFQALAGLWDFKALKPTLPDAKELARRAALVDYHQVELDDAKRSVKLLKKGMKIGLGGIAKGYIVDRASELLTARGFGNHLVNAGGDVYAAGTRGDRPWRLAVRHPRDRSYYATVDVQDRGIATSGNYERFFLKNGKRYHHILDPKTGMPTEGTSSVTVLAKNCMMADAYATSIFVLGEAKARQLADKQNLDVLAFDDDFKTWMTPNMPGKINVLGADHKGHKAAADSEDGGSK